MNRLRYCLSVTALLFTASALAAPAEPAPPADTRTLAELPPQAVALMRQDMLQHLTALNQVIAALASDDLKAAAEVAENGLGKSSMGKHRGDRFAPGMYMPPAMRQIGFGMHEAASELATHAREGKAREARAALARVTGSCVACHSGFRVR